ncbi:hypothetical protein SAMN05421823_103480 [Catalinimonas alkaloidigena]|uniref:Uncharacterized protein n=1 Tax=Catalinimonas alkaloidigena TaxID=1075417 RepID=A0A1G9EI65_9BACT|nr:hypothetical protein SAMN05421823_103480 [Catalinimonas alkaloidigena]
MITLKKLSYTLLVLGMGFATLTACEGNKYVHDDLDNVPPSEVTSAGDSLQVVDTTYNNN